MIIQRNVFKAVGLPVMSALIGSGLAPIAYCLISIGDFHNRGFIESILLTIGVAVQCGLLGCFIAMPLTIMISSPVVYFWGDKFLADKLGNTIVLFVAGGFLGYWVFHLIGGRDEPGLNHMFAVFFVLFGSIIAGLHIPLSRWFVE